VQDKNKKPQKPYNKLFAVLPSDSEAIQSNKYHKTKESI
jgi:hypothetical protein